MPPRIPGLVTAITSTLNVKEHNSTFLLLVLASDIECCAITMPPRIPSLTTETTTFKDVSLLGISEKAFSSSSYD